MFLVNAQKAFYCSSSEVISRLRQPNNYEHYVTRTEKSLRSFLPYCVNNYFT